MLPWLINPAVLYADIVYFLVDFLKKGKYLKPVNRYLRVNPMILHDLGRTLHRANRLNSYAYR